MKQINWFDRKFDFTSQQNIFPSIVERLEGTSIRLNHKVNQIADAHLRLKPGGKWSVQENIGHLIDLEPLWQERLTDILKRSEYMRPADLENTKTHAANHNEKDMTALLHEFENTRQITLNHLVNLNKEEVYQYALHPRLKTPMRVMDLFLFVAEHDDHHLAQISALNKLHTKA